MGAVLQLERFDLVPHAIPPVTWGQADLDAAHAAGLAEGRRQAEALQVETLCAALAGVSRRLDAEGAARADGCVDEIRASAPLIGALLDALVPAAARARLEASLLQELLRLAGSVPPPGLRIRCGPELAGFAAACLATTGLGHAELDGSGPEGTVEAETSCGAVSWDVAAIAGRLRDLVAETMEMT